MRDLERHGRRLGRKAPFQESPDPASAGHVGFRFSDNLAGKQRVPEQPEMEPFEHHETGPKGMRPIHIAGCSNHIGPIKHPVSDILSQGQEVGQFDLVILQKAVGRVHEDDVFGAGIADDIVFGGGQSGSGQKARD